MMDDGSQLPVADKWFRIRGGRQGVVLIDEPHVARVIRANMWLVPGRNRDLLIDSGLGLASLRPLVEEETGRPVDVVLTHAHFDHIGGAHEFHRRMIHAHEAEEFQVAADPGALRRDQMTASERQHITEAGYELPPVLVTALPRAGFSLEEYSVRPAEPTDLLHEGDEINTGDRAFQVLHLPGHSPGSIGLWEEQTGTLFSGDAIYDGPLLDELPESSIDDYLRSMRRLLDLPAQVVYPGHDMSFGRPRLLQLIERYLRRRETNGPMGHTASSE